VGYHFRIGFVLVMVYLLGVYSTISKGIDDYNSLRDLAHDQAVELKVFKQMYSVEGWKEKAGELEGQVIQLQIERDYLEKELKKYKPKKRKRR